jgi:hypothetical protein
MSKHFYNGSKLEISTSGIKIKKRNIKLTYPEITRITIKRTRLSRAGLLIIIAGALVIIAILFLFFLFIRGAFSDATFSSHGGLYYRKRVVVALLVFFIGGPLFIFVKIRKYFPKHEMLVISWKHHDYRVKLSDLGVNASELKRFLEDKVSLTD